MNYSFKRKSAFGYKFWISIICAFLVTIGACVGFTYSFVKAYVANNSNQTIVNENKTTENINKNYNYTYEVYANFGSSSTPSGSQTSLADIVEQVMPATITVKTVTAEGTGAGSGVIVEKAKVKEGGNLIRYEFIALTNYHVINGASESNLSVELFIDGVPSDISRTVSLVGADYLIDVAVLRISIPTIGLSSEVIEKLDIEPVAWLTDGETQTVNSLEDLDLINVSDNQIRLAEDVFVIGNPLGVLGGSVSTGIISAKAREIEVDGIKCTLNQTTATINPGNSGGGIFNFKGELIGLVKAKASGTGVEGLGFSIQVGELFETYVGLRKSEDREHGKYGFILGRKTLGATFAQGYLQENQIALESQYIEQITQTLVTYVTKIDERNINYVGENTFSTITTKESVISKIDVYRHNEEVEGNYELVETLNTINLTPESINELVEKYEIGTKFTFEVRECSTVKEPFEVSVLISQLVYYPI